MREIYIKIRQHIFYSVCATSIMLLCLCSADSVGTRSGCPLQHTEFSTLFPRTLFEGLGGTMKEINIKLQNSDGCLGPAAQGLIGCTANVAM